ncbi:unnamed protein product [Caenorhabditis brenneri]
MFAEGTIELTNLVFNPEESIRFDMDPREQTVVVTMTNNHDFDVISKWKSTRPTVYRFVPTYCVVRAKTAQNIVIRCRGAERERGHPRDRISATISRIRPTIIDARQIWRNHMRHLFEGRIHKKNIFVVYNGLERDEWWNRDMQGNMEQRRQPTFGLAEEDDTSAIEAAIRNGGLMHVLIPLEPGNEEGEGI